MPGKLEFWVQLRERRVLPVTAGYLGLGWALVEVTDFTVARYGLPNRLIDLCFAAIGLLLPLAVFLIWKIGAPGAVQYHRRDLAFIFAALSFAAGGLYLRDEGLRAQELASQTSALTAAAPAVRLSQHEQISQVVIFPFATAAGTEDAWLAHGLPILAEFDLEFDPRFTARAASSSGINGLQAGMQRMGASDIESAPLAVRRRAAIAYGYRALVTGSVTRTDGRLQLKIELYRLQPDQALGPFSISADSAWDAVDQLAALIRQQLAPAQAQAPGNDPALKSITTESLEALRHYVEGRYAIDLGNDSAGSARSFADAERVDPTFVIAAYRSLVARSATQKPDTTINELAALLPRIQVLPPAQRFNLQLFLARMRADRPGMRRVLDAWSRALPWDRTPIYGIADMALDDDPDNAAVLQQLQTLALDSGSASEMAQLSLYLKQRGFSDQALQLAQAALELDESDVATRTSLADILQSRGELDLAAEQLQIAVVLRPDLVSPALQLARLSFNRGDWRSALAQLDALDQRTLTRPEQREPWLRARIEVFKALGRLRAAELAVDQWMELQSPRTAPSARPALYIPYIDLKYRLHGEVAALAWAGKEVDTGAAHINDYYAILRESAIAAETEDGKRLLKAHASMLAAYAAMGQLNAEESIAHWKTFARFWLPEQGLGIAEVQAELDAMASQVRARKQSDANFKSFRVLAIDFALRQNDADAARRWLEPMLRAAPGDPELLLLSSRMHHLAGLAERASAELAKATDAWQEADPEFKPAQIARELERSL
ncbi:MAG: tetratricopeptide repeat protein [Lysobacterales bacterium]